MSKPDDEVQRAGLDPDSSKEISTSPFERLYATGLEFLSEGKYEEAARNFENAARLNRSHRGSLRYLGVALFYLGHFEKAVEQFQQFLKKEPDNEDILWFCGMAYLYHSQYAEAERCLRKVVSLNPKSAKGYLSLGQILYRKGLYTEAVAMFKKADDLEENNPEILFLLGEAYNKSDQIDMAVDCFESVLKKRQDNPKVYYNLGILYDKKSLPEKANLMYRLAKKLSSPQIYDDRRDPVKEAKGDDLFFSRSLTVVSRELERPGKTKLNKKQYKKFREKQLKKKPYRVQVDKEAKMEKVGTMDLTKASLKIDEAIRIIKDKHR